MPIKVFTSDILESKGSELIIEWDKYKKAIQRSYTIELGQTMCVITCQEENMHMI